MSRPVHLKRAGRAGIAIAMAFAFVAVPAAAHASAIDPGSRADRTGRGVAPPARADSSCHSERRLRPTVAADAPAR